MGFFGKLFGGGGGSAPPAPDYNAAAERTAAANRDAAMQQTQANRINQYNPWGSITFDPQGGQHTTLAQPLQSALDSQMGMQAGRSQLAAGMMGNLQQTLGQPMDWSGFTPYQNAPRPLGGGGYGGGGMGGQRQMGQQQFGQQGMGGGNDAASMANLNAQNAALDPARAKVGTQSMGAMGGSGGGMADPNAAPGQMAPGTTGGGGLLPGYGGAGPGARAQGMGMMGGGMGGGGLFGGGVNAGPVQRSLDFSGVQGVQGAAQNRSAAEDAIYKSATSRLDPQWNQRQSQLESQLANQGITRGSGAYTQAMQDFGQQRNDAYNQAQMSSITGGGAEAQRNQQMDLGLRQQQVGEIGTQGQFGNTAQGQAFGQGMQNWQQGLAQQQQGFGQGLQSADFQNRLRTQQINDAMTQRGQGLNEMNALLSGQQVGAPQFAGYNQATGYAGPDYSGAAKDQYTGAMDAYNAQQAGQGNLLKGIGGIASGLLGSGGIGSLLGGGGAAAAGGAAAGAGGFGSLLGTAASILPFFSDERVKRDIELVRRDPRGFGIYRFRYIGELGTRIGVLAQEVRRVLPEAVHSLRGVLMVDYSMI